LGISRIGGNFLGGTMTEEVVLKIVLEESETIATASTVRAAPDDLFANAKSRFPVAPIGGPQSWATNPPPVRVPQPALQSVGEPPAIQAVGSNLLSQIGSFLNNPAQAAGRALSYLSTSTVAFGATLAAATAGFKAWAWTTEFANEQMRSRANIEAKQSRGDVIGSTIAELNRPRLTDYIPIIGQIDRLQRRAQAAGLEAFQTRAAGITERTRQLAQYDPRLAQAVAMADIRQQMTDIQEARITGPARARFVEADSRFKAMEQMAPLAEEIRKANHEAWVRERLIGSKNIDDLRKRISALDKAEIDEGLKGFLKVFRDPNDIRAKEGPEMAKRFEDIMTEAMKNAQHDRWGHNAAQNALDQIWQGLDPHKHPLIFGQGNQQNQPPALNLPPVFNLGVQ
jgi:hypothetical protein